MAWTVDFGRALFDASPDCILLLDEDGRLVTANEACRRLMEAGGAAGQAGEPWVERWPPTERARIKEALAAALTGSPARIQAFCETTGAKKWWDVLVSPIEADTGGARRLLCVCRDVSDLRRTQQELKENKDLLQLGCALSGLALSRIDYDRNALDLSADASRQLGLGDGPMTVPLEEVLSLFHPEDLPPISDKLARAADPAGSGQSEADYRIIRPSGETRWHRGRMQVVFEGEGDNRRASRALLAVHDITKEKAAEETLLRNEEFLRAMLDALPHHVAVIGADGKIIAVNKPWERFALLNGGTPDCVGPGVDYLATARAAAAEGDPYASQAFGGITAVLSGKFDRFVMEYPCHGPNREQWFVLHATRLAWPPAALILSHTDITGRKRNEERRRDAEERLRDSDRNKDEFIATLAHELRNPLAPLRSGLQFIRRAKPGDPALGRMQEIMERQVAHLVRLVDDLLDISRISRGKLELKKEEIDAAAIVRQAITDIRVLVDSKNLAIDVTGLDTALPMTGDPVRVSQIFVNLLDNAIKYTGEDGAISIAAQRTGSYLQIAVSDTGMGIPAQILPQIFDFFTQGERASKQGRAGLGIGLSLVRKLVELHGGVVEAQSEGEGRGACFVVRLPLSETALRLRSNADSRPAGREGRRALLIDDNRDAADSLALALGSLGFDVDVAYSGPEGLARAAAIRPDLVFLDLGMPKMDGYETARALRAQPGGAEIELVALTGWSEDETRRRVKEAGFDGHLIKPVGIEDIAALFLTTPMERSGRGRISNPGKMA